MWLLIAGLMALPPLDDNIRKDNANLIVKAEVVAVYSRVVPNKHGTDDHHVIHARVTGVEKGEAKVGQAIYVHAKQTATRPSGWTGPQGQNHVPGPGKSARFFLRLGPDGSLAALSPNGIDPLGK